MDLEALHHRINALSSLDYSEASFLFIPIRTRNA
jgi:hypothetical protein